MPEAFGITGDCCRAVQFLCGFVESSSLSTISWPGRARSLELDDRRDEALALAWQCTTEAQQAFALARRVRCARHFVTVAFRHGRFEVNLACGSNPPGTGQASAVK